jgi:hypothetical protein
MWLAEASVTREISAPAAGWSSRAEAANADRAASNAAVLAREKKQKEGPKPPFVSEGRGATFQKVLLICRVNIFNLSIRYFCRVKSTEQRTRMERGCLFLPELLCTLKYYF